MRWITIHIDWNENNAVYIHLIRWFVIQFEMMDGSTYITEFKVEKQNKKIYRSSWKLKMKISDVVGWTSLDAWLISVWSMQSLDSSNTFYDRWFET